MTRAEAFAYVAEHGPRVAAALQLIADRSGDEHPLHVRPMGCEEAERLRAERAAITEGSSRDMPTAEPLPVVPAAVPSRCGKYGEAAGFEFYGAERVPASHVCRLDAGHEDRCCCTCGLEFDGR